MRRSEAIQRLLAHELELRHLGVARLSLFGSTARDEAGADSDVDLVAEIDDPRFSLIELISLTERVGAMLGVRADVTTPGSLHPLIRARVLAGAVAVF